ncbi:MAG: hypothetical protein KZQ64_05515 [gamma proteobacterium symbiont of Bathyaustriella thionipta]|nr:hypothetical protein [gamma proteobacterium symbiont of Bathyaustriella thionipta]MCU7952837.1 hypothetical protein [gamma proteobacterium symbiont of Bathyaustriella thionipta]
MPIKQRGCLVCCQQNSYGDILLREEITGKIIISFIDPATVLGLSDSDVVNEVAKIARDKRQ